MAGMPVGRRRHLDHQIWPVHRRAQALGFADRARGVVREMGRHFQAHVTVFAAGLVIDRAQHVRGHLDIFDGQLLVELADSHLGSAASMSRSASS